MIIETFEVLVFLFVFIFMIIALFYYASKFFEERMPFITRFIQKYFISVWILTFLLLFSNFPIYIPLFMLFSQSVWIYVVYHGFPFVNTLSVSFIIAILGTLFSHFLMMMFFLEDETHSLMVTISYFYMFIWAGPIFVLISLCATDEGKKETKEQNANAEENKNEQEQTPRTHSIWNGVFASMLQKIKIYILPKKDRL